MGAYRFYSFHWLSTTQQNNENGADYFIALLSTTQQNNELTECWMTFIDQTWLYPLHTHRKKRGKNNENNHDYFF